MKNSLSVSALIIIIMSTGCATAYKNAVSASYLGNEGYLINARGNGYTSREEMNDYIIQKAFTACYDGHNKGYRIVNKENRPFGSGIHSTNAGETQIQCEGPVDEILKRKFAPEKTAKN